MMHLDVNDLYSLYYTSTLIVLTVMMVIEVSSYIMYNCHHKPVDLTSWHPNLAWIEGFLVLYDYISIFVTTQMKKTTFESKINLPVTLAFQFFGLFLLQHMTYISHSSCSEKGNDCFSEAEMHTRERRKPESGRKNTEKKPRGQWSLAYNVSLSMTNDTASWLLSVPQDTYLNRTVQTCIEVCVTLEDISIH